MKPLPCPFCPTGKLKLIRSGLHIQFNYHPIGSFSVLVYCHVCKKKYWVQGEFIVRRNIPRGISGVDL